MELDRRLDSIDRKLDEVLKKLEKLENAESRNNINPEIKLYDVEELEPILKVTKYTIRSFIHDGSLKAYRIGKNFKVSEKDLLEFLEKSREVKE